MNCRVCGSELPDGALFCGECGSSVTATRVRPPVVSDSRSSDTRIVEPLPKPAVVGRFPGVDEAVGGDAEQEPLAEPTPAPETPVAQEPPVVPEGPEVPRPDGDEPETPHVAFTLSFSTGETVRVGGTGLLGRRPVPQPGETFVQIVAIDDPGRSVSKTHLEFGLEGDELWLLDRYSGNGTIVRPPGGVVRQFEPGRRYRVARGSHVEIGDQYFDVN